VSISKELTGVSEEFAASAFIVFYKEGAAWKGRAFIALFLDCHENGYNKPLGKRVCHCTPVDTASYLRKRDVLSALL
jgi:hypothetical protein